MVRFANRISFYLNRVSLCLIRAILQLALVPMITTTPSVNAQSPHPYRTPQAIELTSQLRADSDFAGTKLRLPLLEWLAGMEAQERVAIWLDRRVPSDYDLSIDIPRGAKRMDVVRAVAESIHAEVAIVDRWVALVPQGKSQLIEWSYWSSFSEIGRAHV